MPIKKVVNIQEGLNAESIPFDKTAADSGKTISKQADVAKQREKLDKESNDAAWERIGTAATAFSKYHKELGKADGVTTLELYAAILLENFNVREFFPTELGGPAHFDTVANTVHYWVDSKTKETTKITPAEEESIIIDDASWERIGKLTDDFNRYHLLYATDHALSETDLAAALLMETENARRHFPAELGGMPTYTALALAVYEWFEINKTK